MPGAEVVVTSFDRPNLAFGTRPIRDDRERFAVIRQRVKDGSGASLIYTPTRRLTELVTRALLRTSIRAAPYHAGLSAGVRRGVLRAFLADRIHVIVATSAFGMGIDKPDVRQVLHWGPPPTLEAYYQEAGRAGREIVPPISPLSTTAPAKAAFRARTRPRSSQPSTAMAPAASSTGSRPAR